MSDFKHQIVVVGGGSAGITAAAQILRHRPGLDVLILDPAKKHYYQPLWTLVGGGIVSKESTEREEESLIPKGARWIAEAVEEFIPEQNKLRTSSGKEIQYEYLIVAPGIQIDWDKIKGLPEALGKNGVCSNYSYEYVEKTWEFIRDFKGGDAIFTFPETPIKCAGAPQKIMYLAEQYFRKSHVREKSRVKFVSAGAGIFGVKKYAKTLNQIIENRGIETTFKHKLVEVRGDAKEAVFENMENGEKIVLKYDLLHVAPPMSAPDFVKKSALAAASGWVDVDKHTLQHLKFPNVFSLGDASSLPTSKTGAAIRKQAPVLVENLLAHMDHRTLSASYNGYTSCPLVTSDHTVVMAEFDYDGNPAETFPFDQSKERRSMYLVKRHLLPAMYWNGMLRGRF